MARGKVTAKKAKKPTAKKATAKKPTAKKATAKKATPKKATPKKATPKKATPKKATPKKATPKKATAKATPKAATAKPRPVTSPAPAPVAAATPAANTDRFRPVADQLVLALQSASGDDSQETAALQRAIDGYLAIAGGGDPAELGLAEYFAEDGSAANPPALERVAGATDDDIYRWRMKLADLAGY